MFQDAMEILELNELALFLDLILYMLTDLSICQVFIGEIKGMRLSLSAVYHLI